MVAVQSQLPDRNSEPNMENPKAERGSRGRYARLICRGCRSRKIKYNLPDELGPLGPSQTPENSCERCRSLNLECIVERTTLGRPSLKRDGNARSRGANPLSRSDSDSRNVEGSPPISSLEIKGHLATKSIDDLETTKKSQILVEKSLLQSTFEFQKKKKILMLSVFVVGMASVLTSKIVRLGKHKKSSRGR